MLDNEEPTCAVCCIIHKIDEIVYIPSGCIEEPYCAVCCIIHKIDEIVVQTIAFTTQNLVQTYLF